MARFRGTIQGQATDEVSRLGTASSGIEAKINGWNAGVSVRAYVTTNSRDGFSVYATSGSNGNKPEKLIGTIEETKDGYKFIPA